MKNEIYMPVVMLRSRKGKWSMHQAEKAYTDKRGAWAYVERLVKLGYSVGAVEAYTDVITIKWDEVPEQEKNK